ncbi:MAG: hypothetical protein RQ842_04605 [Vulcanisaeta sp.]|nr:hypothetical protein [Vulcanisaeta sp.]
MSSPNGLGAWVGVLVPVLVLGGLSCLTAVCCSVWHVPHALRASFGVGLAGGLQLPNHPSLGLEFCSRLVSWFTIYGKCGGSLAGLARDLCGARYT